MTAVFAVVAAGMLWALTPPSRLDPPGPAWERRLPPPEVGVWVGELGGGLRGVLAPVHGDPVPDVAHAELWSEHLGLPEGRRLGFARLVVANPGTQPGALDLREGTLRVRQANGAIASTLDLGARLDEGGFRPPEGWAFVMRVLGPLRDTIEVAPGRSDALLLPFDGAVDLVTATAVDVADGPPWTMRRTSQEALRRLLASRRASDLEDLLP